VIRQNDPKAGRVLVARGYLAASANDARGANSLDRSEKRAGILDATLRRYTSSVKEIEV
jgi:hypothetical protein